MSSTMYFYISDFMAFGKSLVKFRLDYYVDVLYSSSSRLNTLFCGLHNLDPIRYNVYCSQLELASKTGFLEMVTIDIDQVRKLCRFFVNESPTHCR